MSNLDFIQTESKMNMVLWVTGNPKIYIDKYF